MKLSNNDKLFKCNVCLRSVGDSKIWQEKHIKTFHDGKKLYSCSKCPTFFASQAAMANHQMSVHNIIRQKHKWQRLHDEKSNQTYVDVKHFLSATSKHACKICSKYDIVKIAFANKISTFRHIQPISCKLCKASFCFKEDFLTHVEWEHEKNLETAKKDKNETNHESGISIENQSLTCFICSIKGIIF